MKLDRRRLLAFATLGTALTASSAVAQKLYGPGASDTEIKIGNTSPYSGPASPYAQIAKVEAAYFKKINAEGGINGRMIKFISYDDAYNPAKTVEQARKLVEDDEVLLIFNSLGTPTNTAIRKYMNERKVPQLFVASGAAKWNDPAQFPWTMGWQPSYQGEARIYAQYLLKHHPRGRIGVIYQNDDYGRDYLNGLKDGLGGTMAIVAEIPYEATDQTIDSAIVAARAAGADILFDVSGPKAAAQAIRKLTELDWKPLHILNNVAASVGSTFKPVGLENAKGILSSNYGKDPTDAAWKDDPGFKEWEAFMDRYFPEGDKTSTFASYGYGVAQTLVQVLRQCGDDLTRKNVMRQAASLKDLQLGMSLPGVTINTGPGDYAPIKQLRMMRFNGETWELLGSVLNVDGGGG